MYDVAAVLTSIQSLLSDPNPSSPANPKAARVFTEDKALYARLVLLILVKGFFWRGRKTYKDEEGEEEEKEKRRENGGVRETLEDVHSLVRVCNCGYRLHRRSLSLLQIREYTLKLTCTRLYPISVWGWSERLTWRQLNCLLLALLANRRPVIFRTRLVNFKLREWREGEYVEGVPRECTVTTDEAECTVNLRDLIDMNRVATASSVKKSRVQHSRRILWRLCFQGRFNKRKNMVTHDLSGRRTTKTSTPKTYHSLSHD
ncbi:UNVERIFIED_CONTAM: hypothetical protein H355_005284 [Colinus virginianus]|nr:hypothetical protein H355_005284 [Colinus virginianus]